LSNCLAQFRSHLYIVTVNAPQTFFSPHCGQPNESNFTYFSGVQTCTDDLRAGVCAQQATPWYIAAVLRGTQKNIDQERAFTGT